MSKKNNKNKILKKNLIDVFENFSTEAGIFFWEIGDTCLFYFLSK